MRIVSDTPKPSPTESVHPPLVRFSFETTIHLGDAEDTLLLARLAVESLFGASRVSLEARYQLLNDQRCIEIDTAGEVGSALVTVFHGYVIAEFGGDAIRVERLLAEGRR